MSAPRLDMETKNQIVDAYVAGEKIADIAERFGVHQTYPKILARRRGHLVADRRTRDAGVWQPMETAPKDGTAILTYSFDAAVDGRPYPMLIVAWDLPWEWTILSEDGTTQTGTDYEPTHWMPLPQPPAIRGGR